MYRQTIKSLFFSALLCAVTTLCTFAAATEIAIDKLATQLGSTIIQQPAVKQALQQTLAADYDEFIANFDVCGEPQLTTDGGLWVDGWLEHLYLQNASVLIIYPDGTVAAAWVSPDSPFIHYRNSHLPTQAIHPAIQTWAAHFPDYVLPPAQNQSESSP